MEIKAQISFDKEAWINCVIINRSLVGFSLETKENIEIIKGSKCWLRVNGYYDIPAILVWGKSNKAADIVRLGIRAFELIARYEREKTSTVETGLTGIIRITHKKKGNIEWGNIIRVLNKFDELIGAISDMMITIDDSLQTDLHLGRPVLVSLKFGSPGELQTKVDLGLADILKILIEKFQYWSLDKQRYIEENRKKNLKISI